MLHSALGTAAEFAHLACASRAVRAQVWAEPPQRSAARGCSEADAAWETGKQKVRGAERTLSEEMHVDGLCHAHLNSLSPVRSMWGALGSRQSRTPGHHFSPPCRGPTEHPQQASPSLPYRQGWVGAVDGGRKQRVSHAICPQALLLLGCYPSG